jgi:hypothetical protein
MSILRAGVSPVKPRSVLPPPQFCPRCSGSGWLGYDPDTSVSIECPECLGWGQAPEPEPVCPACFVAVCGTDEIDVGLHLGAFLFQLLSDWPMVDSDIVVWECTASEPSTWKVVAVLSPGRAGTQVRHL